LRPAYQHKTLTLFFFPLLKRVSFVYLLLMKKKVPFLLPMILFFNCSCTIVNNNSIIKKPPQEQFVKIYKKIDIKKCSKTKQTEKVKEEKKCETRSFVSTGSGLIIYLVDNYTTVLSAGHVCSSEGLIAKEDNNFTYEILKEEISVLNYKNKIFKAKVVLAEQGSETSADLCTLVVPKLKLHGLKPQLAMREPRVGEDIYYMGAPVGIYHPPTVLIIKGVYSGKIDKYAALAGIHAAPGASGSVILSTDGKIYGVLFAVHPRFPSATVITSFSSTRNFLLRSKKFLEIVSLQSGGI